MDRKLLVTRLQGHIMTFLQENGEIVEIHCSPEEREKVSLGNIYVGKVKNIVANIQAAFIEIAKGVECYYAIDRNESPFFTHKIGKKPLCIGDELLVQVEKEAVKTKAPTVSSKLTFTGKYAVLTTQDTRIGTSNKLSREEKERLTQIAGKYRSEEYGWIIRTNAKNADEALLEHEMQQLIQEYEDIKRIAATRTCYSCLKKMPRQYLTELRNIYQEGSVEIIVEDTELYEEMRAYMTAYQPEDLEKLTHYEDKLLPLHKLYSLEKHLEQALKEHVWLKSGGYLVIQPTEALTVIDVNTGKCVSKKKDDQLYLKINLEAAKEAARQLRLRNLSGIVIIDFVNISDEELRMELYDALRRELRKDPIQATFVDVTKLQLVEVTRKKVRKPLYESIKE